ncbi:DUF4234 domain-containing protein [Natranaerobius trueperi]|uniref:DUF4234 domain-containing protein n=1 Tax=Natranaerobius trueperi TaxID=759412 RepID=A0A226C145_9FIRM|nr:DUF4234 domain-containing protein [Natranaerobius trueperi]OWZ84983.1 hypothetical protein CDO51_00850 [Natranaerobius trueperi]
MKKRSIGMMILLTLITFGFYSVYWYIAFQSDLKSSTGEGFGGLGHIFLTIITFGIYYILWQYFAGKRIAAVGGNDHSLLYLVLTIFSLSWINPFLMQYQVNNAR